MPDGAFLREACWHSAGLAFLPQAEAKPPGRGEGRRRSPRLRANGDSGNGSTLPRHYLDELSTGAKLKRPAGEGMGTGKVPIRTRHGWNRRSRARMRLTEARRWARLRQITVSNAADFATL